MYRYETEVFLTEKYGNNAFAWDMRKKQSGKSPTLTIPARIIWSAHDVVYGDAIVFEEYDPDAKTLISCTWLKHFIEFAPTSISAAPGIIFDNHNHALYFWIDALKQGYIQPWFELIHIDEHSDLWDNPHDFDIQTMQTDEKKLWEFVNISCNVGNYILPALRSGLIASMIRIENEYQIDQYTDYIPQKNSVLNLDLDIFAPELNHIDRNKKLNCIQHYMQHVQYITVATSPFFLSPERALEALHDVFSLRENTK